MARPALNKQRMVIRVSPRAAALLEARAAGRPVGYVVEELLGLGPDMPAVVSLPVRQVGKGAEKIEAKAKPAAKLPMKVATKAEEPKAIPAPQPARPIGGWAAKLPSLKLKPADLNAELHRLNNHQLRARP